MASEIIEFLERSFEIPYIAIFALLIILLSDLFYDYKIRKMSDSYMRDEIKELKRENEELKGVIDSYVASDN